MRCLRADGALEALAGSPAAAWQQHAPPRWTVAVAILGVAVARSRRAACPARAGRALAPAVVRRACPTPPPDGAFRMTVLDVGQGSRSSWRRMVTRSSTTPGRASARRGRRRRRASSRRSCAPRACARLVGADRHPRGQRPQRRRADAACDRAGRLVRLVAARGASRSSARGRRRNVARCEAGQRWRWDGVRFTVLHPTAAHYARWHASSPTICRASCGSTAEHGRVLLAGDIEARERAELVRAMPPRRSRRCAVGAASRQPHVVDAGVRRGGRARIAVYPPGYRNRFGHPRT